MSRKTIGIIAILFIILMIGAFVLVNVNKGRKHENQKEQAGKTQIQEEENNKVENIKIKVNNEVLIVKLEQNSSSEALVERLKQGDITIDAHDYENFEKVGDLGFNLPTNDTRITTKPGDLILYQGNQITIFYGTNSWSYTKLGEVIGKSKNELKTILGSGNATLVLSMD